MSPKKPKTKILRKCWKKSPALNAWAATFNSERNAKLLAYIDFYLLHNYAVMSTQSK